MFHYPFSFAHRIEAGGLAQTWQLRVFINARTSGNPVQFASFQFGLIIAPRVRSMIL
jgi:hypothetical protein